jgi:acyl-CoA reductase-like NAD-dependent aldehyde dehydrogenase
MKSLQHYIEGRWVAPVVMGERFPVIDPATESQVA